MSFAAKALNIGVSLGRSMAGLTDLVGQPVDNQGHDVGSPIATVEVGGGNYLLNILQSDAAQGVKFYSASAPTVILAFAGVDDDYLTNYLSNLAYFEDGIDVTGGTLADGHYRLSDVNDYRFIRLGTTHNVNLYLSDDLWYLQLGTDVQNVWTKAAVGPYGIDPTGTYSPNPGHTTGNPVVSWHMPASEATSAAILEELDDQATRLAAIQAKTALITAGGVTVRSPLLPNGDLLLYKRADYGAATKLIQFTDDGGNWPAITGGGNTVKLRIWKKSDPGVTLVQISGTIVSQTVVTFAPTHTTLAVLNPAEAGIYEYAVEVTIGGLTWPLATGDCLVELG